MKKTILLVLLLVFLLSACSFGGATQRSSRNGNRTPDTSPTATEAPSPIPATLTAIPLTLTPTESPLPDATHATYPLVALAQDSVCRTGPAKRYYSTGFKVSKGQTLEANGRNEDSSWVSLQAPKPGDYCWVSFTSLEAVSDVSGVQVAQVQALPDAPINVTAIDGACGHRKNLWLYWYPVYGQGYYIYRNGQQIGSEFGGDFRDIDTPQVSKPTVFLYEIEAFNASGASERSGVSVTICE